MNQSTSQSDNLVILESFDPGKGTRREETASGRRQLFGLDRSALVNLFGEMGERPYRGRQLAEALYRQRFRYLDQITTLPQSLRDRMTAAGWEVGRSQIAETFRSVDGTERYLIQTGSQTVETVWMPEGDGGAELRKKTMATAVRPAEWVGNAPPSVSPARLAARSTASSASRLNLACSAI